MPRLSLGTFFLAFAMDAAAQEAAPQYEEVWVTHVCRINRSVEKLCWRQIDRFECESVEAACRNDRPSDGGTRKLYRRDLEGSDHRPQIKFTRQGAGACHTHSPSLKPAPDAPLEDCSHS